MDGQWTHLRYRVLALYSNAEPLGIWRRARLASGAFNGLVVAVVEGDCDRRCHREYNEHREEGQVCLKCEGREGQGYGPGYGPWRRDATLASESRKLSGVGNGKWRKENFRRCGAIMRVGL